mgnify:CR=1 FL=1
MSSLHLLSNATLVASEGAHHVNEELLSMAPVFGIVQPDFILTINEDEVVDGEPAGDDAGGGEALGDAEQRQVDRADPKMAEARHHRQRHGVDDVRRDQPARIPPAAEQPDDIGQPIPFDRERPDLHRDRVDHRKGDGENGHGAGPAAGAGRWPRARAMVKGKGWPTPPSRGWVARDSRSPHLARRPFGF